MDLAFKAVKDDIVRAEDGRWWHSGPKAKPCRIICAGFVQENPELLPARIAGGSGARSPREKRSPWRIGRHRARQDQAGNEQGRSRPRASGDFAAGLASHSRRIINLSEL